MPRVPIHSRHQPWCPRTAFTKRRAKCSRYRGHRAAVPAATTAYVRDFKVDSHGLDWKVPALPAIPPVLQDMADRRVGIPSLTRTAAWHRQPAATVNPGAHRSGTWRRSPPASTTAPGALGPLLPPRSRRSRRPLSASILQAVAAPEDRDYFPASKARGHCYGEGDQFD